MEFNRLKSKDHMKAKSMARKAIIEQYGKKPLPEDYIGYSQSKFPPSVNRAVYFLTFIVLLAAFAPSAMRLYKIGSETFGHAGFGDTAMAIAGVSSIMLAETGMILFSMFLAIAKNGHFYLKILIGCSIAYALLGNFQLAMPGQWQNPFAWLEALFPPVAVLGAGYVLKEQVLLSIEIRHENYLRYQEALSRWINETEKPENHEDYVYELVTAVWEILYRINRKKTVREWLDNCALEDRQRIVMVELEEGNWAKQLGNDFKRLTAPTDTQTTAVKPQTTNLSVMVDEFCAANPEIAIDTKGYPVRQFAETMNSHGYKIGKDAANKYRRQWIDRQ
jgi:hypothetical protein